MFGVVLAGGSGTRFWPKSRRERPKQLINISPETTKTMIELTIERIAPVVAQTFIITNALHLAQTASILPPEAATLVAEPAARNTAAAVGLAAFLLEKIDPNGVMAVFPADHTIADEPSFHKALREAEACAEKGFLVTFGVKPDHPETGYGYIEAASEGLAGTAGRKVSSFKEKPDLPTAVRYLADGNYFWNSGMFVWRISTIIRELEEHLPELTAGLRRIVAKIGPDYDLSQVAEDYARLPKVSIDCGVMEQSDKVTVLPVDFGWNDVGCWSALDDIAKEKDKDGNVLLGKVLPFKTKNSIVCGKKRLIVTIGIEDIVVVETDDVVLVCHKSCAQDVKKVVEELEKKDWQEYL